jgi:glucose/arabinose dehydrogenase
MSSILRPLDRRPVHLFVAMASLVAWACSGNESSNNEPAASTNVGDTNTPTTGPVAGNSSDAPATGTPVSPGGTGGTSSPVTPQPTGTNTDATQPGGTTTDDPTPTNVQPSPVSSGEDSTPGPDDTGEPEPTTCSIEAAPPIQRLGLETVVQTDDLKVMVYAAQPPGSEDWYLVDALGVIRVYSGGQLQATPFLDVRDEVQNSGFTGTGAPSGGSQNYDERGLLSIAFPPDYATSGKFYVSLIPTSGDLTDHDLVLEYSRSRDNPLVADVSTRRAIADLEPGGEGYTTGTGFSYAKYHNGSTVLFGPDGKLYWGLGDGGGECNAAHRGAPQDVNSPYGKILRLDPSLPAPHAPADNPFVEGGDPRVLHYGVRNPFRFTFDPVTGDLYIGEVGQWTNDSIAHAKGDAKGVNFGWPSFEGITPNPSGQCNNNTPLRAGTDRRSPIYNLAHGSTGGVANLITTIVGGAVYRGKAIPELRGAYLFGEFYPNRPMRALYQCGDETSPVTTIAKRCDPNTPNAPCFVPQNGAPELRQVGAIVYGNDGELYIPANGNAILKIVPVAQ